MSELISLIIEYLDEARMMQVATSINDQPWACTVYFAFDGHLYLYWISHPLRRHSTELKQNPKVAGTIVMHHTPGGPVRGLQFQGVAEEITEPDEVRKALKFYAERYGLAESRVEDIVNGTDGHKCYRIRPQMFVLFDEVNFPGNSRQEYVI